MGQLDVRLVELAPSGEREVLRRTIDCQWERQVSIYDVEYLRFTRDGPGGQSQEQGASPTRAGVAAGGDARAAAERKYRIEFVIAVPPDGRQSNKIKLLDLLVF